MKKFSCAVAAVLMALVMGMVSCGPVWAVDSVEEQKLQLPRITISTGNYVFKPGEKLVFSVNIFNPADYPVRLLDTGIYNDATDAVAPFFSLRLSGLGSAVVKKQDGALRFSGKEKFFVLDPGKTVSYTFDLSAWVGEKLAPGKYNFVVGHVRGVSVADSSPVIFEVVSEKRARQIGLMEKTVRQLLRSKTPGECTDLIASGGVWVETAQGGMSLYSSAFLPEFISELKLPRPKKQLDGHIFYLPAYDAVFVGQLGQNGEIFSFKTQNGEPKVSRISDLL